MNNTEKILLDKLQKPMKEAGSIAINVRRFYTDVQGVIIDKSTVPAALQVPFPVYIWGEFDRQGAYFIGNRILPPSLSTPFLQTFAWGAGANPYFFGFTGLSDIQTQILPGSLVQVYADDLLAPNYFIWIVQSVSKASLASIVANSVSERPDGRFNGLDVERVQYFTDNPDQWNNPIFVWETDLIGNIKQDSFSPYIFRTPKVSGTNFIEIQWRFPVNQYRGSCVSMLFDTDYLLLDFKFKQ